MSKEIRLSVVIDDEELKKKFKLLCAIRQVSMKEQLENLIQKEVQDNLAKLDSLM